MSHIITFATTLSITLADSEAEYECRVTGYYQPFRRGDSPMSYSGPTPDEPEAFELDRVFARLSDKHHFQEIPAWLITEEHVAALQREGIEAHAAQRDEAMIRRGEEREDMRRVFGDPQGGDDA